MIKAILTTLIAVNSLISFGQQAKPTTTSLTAVNNIDDAKLYIESNPRLEGKLFTLSPGIDSTELFDPLFQMKTGYTFKLAGYMYKIVGVDSSQSLKVSYIYLDGERLTKTAIDSLRDKIISQYKNGISFNQLAQTYNMDGNVTGSLGWVREDYLAPEFVEAVKSHKKGEIFTVDIPSRKWYYVVSKTHDESYIKTLTILRIKSSS